MRESHTLNRNRIRWGTNTPFCERVFVRIRLEAIFVIFYEEGHVFGSLGTIVSPANNTAPT